MIIGSYEQVAGPWLATSREEARDPTGNAIRRDGLVIEVSGADVTLAADDRWVVACEGRPRFSSGHEEPGGASRWLEEIRAVGLNARTLAEIRGNYCAVIVDCASRSIVLSCDRFALRTLCYQVTADKRVIFGTRADLVAHRTRPAIDLQALYDYFYFHVIPAPRTIFAEVSRLEAGHFVRVHGGTATIERYWTPRFEPVSAPRFDTLQAEFRELIAAAVARESRGGAVGAFLSGGTDSSTVVGMMRQVLGQPPDAYSIGFDSAGYDEMGYARIAARHFGAAHHEYYMTPTDLVAGIPVVASHYDQPFGNSSALPGFVCASRARDDGLVKLLAGDGGDELFGGNTRYAKQRVFEAYHALPASLRKKVLEPVAARDAMTRVPVVKKAASYVRQASVGMPARLNTYNLLERLGVTNVLTAPFLAAVNRMSPIAQQQATYDAIGGAFVDRMLAYDWKYTLAENDLPKVCGTTALASMDVGFPFLADEIVDFSLRLPASWKVRGLRLRYFFKEALRGFLPDEILRKKKHGFGLPFGPWLLVHEGLMRLARESVFALAERGVVHRRFVEALLGARLAEHPGYYGEMVWIMMMLEQWLRTHAPGFRIREGGVDSGFATTEGRLLNAGSSH